MVNKPLDLVSTVISPLLFLLLAAGGVCAAEGDQVEPPAEEGARIEAPAAEGSAGELTAEPDPQLMVELNPVPAEYDRHVESLEQKGGSLGYSFLSRDGNAGRALEYGFLESSRSGGLFYRHMEKESNLELDGFYLNENDYHGDLLLDYRGDYRLHLRTESLYHNLDREILFSPEFRTGRADPPPPTAADPDPDPLALYRPVQDPMAEYGVSVVQDRADFRYRLHNYPLHVNLGYWRYQKEGTMQQRFADVAFEGPQNWIRAEARSVDQQIQQGRFGLDAHLGPVDLLYDLKYRHFEDKLPTPVFSPYEARNDLGGNPEQLGGGQQHNDNPDSRFVSHTLKLHTSLDGGLVAGGSYSIEQRENLSQLSDTTGIRHAKSYLRSAAGDLVYTPSREYSLFLKYRRQELDHGYRNTLLSTNFADPVQVVKPPIDTTKDILIASVAYKPRPDLSLVGEFRAEFLKRNNVSELPAPTSWALPENSFTRAGSLALYYRPIKGLRSSAHYSYAATDNPSYGASSEQRREGKLLGTYSRSNSWGVTAHAVLRHEKNDEVEHFLIFPLDPLTYTPYPPTSRDRRTENSNIGIWFVPIPKLTVGGNYAYLRTKGDGGSGGSLYHGLRRQ